MSPAEARRRLAEVVDNRCLAQIDPASLNYPARTAADIVHHLEEQIQAVRGNSRLDDTDRARLIGALCAVSLRAIEQAEGEARLRAVEHILQQRAEVPKRAKTNGYL